jgi:hypothetical protein
MCTKYSVCGINHPKIPKWKTSKRLRNRKGQFDRNRWLIRNLLIGISIYAISVIGVNTIIGWAKSFEDVFVVGEAKAELTWQQEVHLLLLNSGIDIALADRIIQRESWWDYTNTHINKDGTRDRGLWMFHEVYHAEVSDECAYDPICSTKEAIRVWKARGPQEWTAYQYVK